LGHVTFISGHVPMCESLLRILLLFPDMAARQFMWVPYSLIYVIYE
jgi:hypothetical protein